MHDAAGIEHYVVGFYIAMDYSGVMRRRQSLCNLYGDGRGVRDPKAALPLEQIRECPARHVIHYYIAELRLGIFAYVMHADEIAVMHLLRECGLVGKALSPCMPRRAVRRLHHFNGIFPASGALGHEIDSPHAAFAEEPLHDKTPERFAGR